MNYNEFMTYFIGIDGGGTKTEVLVADESGKIVGRGLAGSSSLSSGSKDEAIPNLRYALGQATNNLQFPVQVKSLVMGLAGVDSDEEIAAARQFFAPVFRHFQLEKFTLVNDGLIALASGTDKEDAMFLITGTGSNCIGKNKEGKYAKVSGLDFLLADQGSAYDVGSRVLRAAAASFDDRGEKTILEEKLCEYFKVDSVLDLKSKLYDPPLNKREIAKLAKLCDAAFEQGDQVTKQIFNSQIAEIKTMISTVMRKLGFLEKDFDLVWIGGLKNVSYIRDEVEKQMHIINPKINFIFPDQSPVHGALKMAINDHLS